MTPNRRLAAFILSLALLLGLPMGKSSKAYAQVQVSFNTFYTSLSPYGHWVNAGNYGPCWRPSRTQSGWQPYYSNGHWAYTEYGWTWISSEPWGHIAYHYGTWYNDPNYGWLWVPGYNWAPAWVTWQYKDGYVGWGALTSNYFAEYELYNVYDLFYRNADYNYYGRLEV